MIGWLCKTHVFAFVIFYLVILACDPADFIALLCYVAIFFFSFFSNRNKLKDKKTMLHTVTKGSVNNKFCTNKKIFHLKNQLNV